MHCRLRLHIVNVGRDIDVDNSNAASGGESLPQRSLGMTKLSPANRSHASRQRRGFSLTELMVVVVIIGMLATAVTMNVIGKSDTARRTIAISDISRYINAVHEFYAENGRYPTNDEGLAVLAAPRKSSRQGYINKVNKDPWKRPYQYFVPGTKKDSPFEILCYGADGKEGGTDVNADISSENLDNE
jgi:general secretion pathway protein G